MESRLIAMSGRRYGDDDDTMAVFWTHHPNDATRFFLIDYLLFTDQEADEAILANGKGEGAAYFIIDKQDITDLALSRPEPLGDYVIFSASEGGFWSTDFGWLASLDEADRLNDMEAKTDMSLPGPDAEIKAAGEFKIVSHDIALAKLVGEIFYDRPGDEITEFVNQHTELDVAYEGDSIWLDNAGDLMNSGDLKKKLIYALSGLEDAPLVELFNATCEGSIFSTGDDSYILQDSA